MKEVWIELDDSMQADEKDKTLRASLPICTVAVVSLGDIDLARRLGAKRVASYSEGNIRILPSVDEKEIARIHREGACAAIRATVRTREDEDIVIRGAEAGLDYVILQCPNWKVIPLENLIAKTRGRSKLIAQVKDLGEARIALEALELGADGVLLRTGDSAQVVEAEKLIHEADSSVELALAKIIGKRNLGNGARVCVDTCDIMQEGEGMLVGCQSSGLFLVEAEVRENPHVEPRPFRVNAGPVSSYILMPEGRTRYLSELKTGDEILIVGREGRTRVSTVGRIKMELRPLLLLEAECQGHRLKGIVQNAETIRLVSKSGSLSVSEIKPGDEVLIRYEEGGRHFGTLVKEESVIER